MRNRGILLLLLPIIIFLWLVGWNLLWLGSQNKPITKKARTPPKEDEIEILTIPPEEAMVEPKDQ